MVSRMRGACFEREGIVGRHFANPQRVEISVTGGQRDVESLVVGPVEPERQGDCEMSVHNVDASAG
ncbi:hypothetical protein ACVWWN_005531 [Mycobacterium sp. URHB0021]